MALSEQLSSLPILIVDCQAAGASPAHGDLLEIGWTLTNRASEAQAHWLLPSTDRVVPRAVRKLTGWDESCLENAIDPLAAWMAMVPPSPEPVPTAIHFARFELPFLRDLHTRAVGGDGVVDPFPLDVVCLHAIATRLFPDLPRLGLRALAGHLGYSADQNRRALGHVEASVFIWSAFAPRLAESGIATWDDLKTWIESVPSSRGTRKTAKRAYPMPAERRAAMPDAPGVYRFLRPNGDVLYVGKATSLKKRIASYFTGAGTKMSRVERTLEMLTQAHDINVSITESALEAALLETDEIKRIDPPYNVHLRARDREAWFATPTWSASASSFSSSYCVGPLPSPNALAGIGAMHALLLRDQLDQEHDDPLVRAAAVGVPHSFAPPAELFDQVWKVFAAKHNLASGGSREAVKASILRASRSIVIVASDETEDDEGDVPASIEWDATMVERQLERTIVLQGSLVRRARLLGLLSHAEVAFQEKSLKALRVLVLERGCVVAANQSDATTLAALINTVVPRAPSRAERLSRFNAATYDRIRVLATELQRITDQDGIAAFRINGRRWMTLEKTVRSRAHALNGTRLSSTRSL